MKIEFKPNQKTAEPEDDCKVPVSPTRPTQPPAPWEPQLELAFHATGRMSANQVLFQYNPLAYMRLPIDLAGSRCTATVPATQYTALALRKNGAVCGFINFAVGACHATFCAPMPVEFNSTDSLTILAPGTPDHTLESVAGSLVCLRQPRDIRPTHLAYLGDNVTFFGHFGGVGVYYDSHTRRGQFSGRQSTVISREDYEVLRADLDRRGIKYEHDGGWR